MIEPGRYRHYKGGEYVVLMTATDADTGETMVVYEARDTGKVWIREATEWGEYVTHPTTKLKVPRFEKV